MAKILEGKAVAAALTSQIGERVAELQKKKIHPVLAIVRVGAKPEDLSYERGASKRAEKAGIAIKQCLFGENVTQEELISCIDALNKDEDVHGVLIFRPLPEHISDEAVRNALVCEKDIDGITNDSMAGTYCGSGIGFAPCTAEACMEVLKYYDINPAGKAVAVVGRSLVIGKPVASLLLKENATVTQCHTKTTNTPQICRDADIIVVATGNAGLITADYCNAHQTILDVGVNVGSDGKMTGDVCFEEAEQIVDALTPVPGGIGAVTTTVLMKHVIEAAEKAADAQKKGFFRLY